MLLGILLLAAPAGRADPPPDAEELGACADADPTEPLLLTLTPPDRAALDGLLRAQLDPDSPQYRRWLTPAEFGERFGPPATDYAAAADWLRQQGFADVRTWAGRLGIAFRGTAGQVTRAFGTRLRAYRWRGRIRMAPERAPVVPRFGATRATGLLGLDGFVRVTPGVRIGSAERLAPRDVYVVHRLSEVYAAGVTGGGVTLAVLAVSDFNLADVALFRRTFGVAPGTVEKRFVGANPGSSDPAALGEVLLDTQWSGAIAPGATVVAQIAPDDNTAAFAAAALDLVNDDVADVVSVSFGVCERLVVGGLARQIDDLARQASAQGTSVFVSSGDDGVADCRRQTGSLAASVNAFASSPYVTAVGGTTLDPDFDAAGNATGYGGETVWNDTADPRGGAGGGGRSIFFAKPSYQRLPGLPEDGARDVPDVAFAASPGSPGFAVAGGGVILPLGVGGTSASAPVWAGMAALLVQKRGGRLGLLNGELYRLGAEQAAGSGPVVFHDVTRGDNGLPSTRGFAAQPGYDLATGWGSFDAPALLAAFAPGPACESDADCDDGDGCTDDLCAGEGACVRAPVLGADAVACVFDREVTRTCEVETPAPVARRVARARRLLQRTTARASRAVRLVVRAGRQVDGALRLVRRSRRLSPGCAIGLQEQLARARAQALHLRRLLAP